VYAYNTLHEPTLVGQLWIKTPTGTVQGPGYRLQTSYPSEFVTNGEGRWALPAGRRLPFGGVSVDLVDDKSKEFLAAGDLCFPIPILGALTGGEQKFRLTYDPVTRDLDALPTVTCLPSLSGLVLFAQAPSPLPIAPSPSDLYITIRDVRLVSTGHSDTAAEVYFKIFRNSREYNPRGIPQRASRNGWLLLRDDELAVLDKGMTFTVATGDVIDLQIWDRDRSFFSFFKNEDDQLASVQLNTKITGPGRHTLHAQNGSTLTVELHK
jgi:hypothetical protein